MDAGFRDFGDVLFRPECVDVAGVVFSSENVFMSGCKVSSFMFSLVCTAASLLIGS